MWAKMKKRRRGMFYVQSKPQMKCGLEFDTIKLSDVTDPELHSSSSITGLFPSSRHTAVSTAGRTFLIVFGL